MGREKASERERDDKLKKTAALIMAKAKGTQKWFEG